MFRIPTSQSHGQLDIGVLIAQRSDVYEEFTKLSGDSPPALRFLMQSIFIEAQLKKGKIGVFSMFFSVPIEIYHIANQRRGGDSTHINASFSHTSFCCAINAQILNCPRGFSEVYLLCEFIRYIEKPTAAGMGPRPACSRIIYDYTHDMQA